MRYLIIYLLVAVFLLPAAEIQWHAGNGLENWKGLFRLKCEYKQDLLVLTSIGYDSAIWCDQVRIDSEKLNTLEITYRATGIRAKTTGQLYYKNDRGFWFAIYPLCGLCIGSGDTRKAAELEAKTYKVVNGLKDIVENRPDYFKRVCAEFDAAVLELKRKEAANND